MTSVSAGSRTRTPPAAVAASGPFMLTLCELPGPVNIRPSQSPQLKRFTLFTSHARRQDGRDALYLHMGYFQTLSEAQTWMRAIRGRYPNAIATLAPPSVVGLFAGGSAGERAASAGPAPAASPVFAPVRDPSLSDSQVLRILEARRVGPAEHQEFRRDAPIGLVRPEDTSVRLALKEAVVEGAAVPFAVQLHWSPSPIDPLDVPALAAFKAHTLYAIESRRQGRSCYFLRLGFFDDPVSAKDVAGQFRSHFASSAVVPVTAEERARARAARSDSAAIPCLVLERATDAKLESPQVAVPPKTAPVHPGPQRVREGDETLEQTLARLAERESWSDPDATSESGVRHLKFEVQERGYGLPNRKRSPRL